jgi:hypothetical protein
MKSFKTFNVGYRLFALLLVLFLLSPGYTAASEENLGSNVDGKIRVIIFHYGNGAYFRGFWFDETVLFRDLMDKMDKDVGFVILVGKDYKGDKVKEVLEPYAAEKLPDGTARVKYLTVDVKTSQFYPWARDAYFIQTDKDNNLIFLDAGFNEQPFPITNFDEVFAGARTRAGTIHRGGGNVRTSSEEVFIGMDTILGVNTTPRWSSHFVSRETLYSNAKEYKKEDLPVLRKRLDAYADLLHHILAPERKLVVPGKERFFAQMGKEEFKFTRKVVHSTGAQAAYHTDVFLGLGHKDKNGIRTLFVADCKPAAAIVENMSPEERRKVERLMPGILVEEGFTAAGVPISREQIEQGMQWEKHKLLDLSLEKYKEIADTLDENARHLEQMGYRVVRIPYLPNGLDNEDDRNDGFLGLSFNYSNVLVEVYGDVKRVYMPRFGFKELDEAAAGAYESAGFRVIFIKGLLTNAVTSRDAGAGLDCMTSEIRTPVRWAKE